MSAKEMFEKLGHELIIKDNNVIDYRETKTNTYYVEFDLINKFLWTYLDINIDLLQAINKQVEELGWLESDNNESDKK